MTGCLFSLMIQRVVVCRIFKKTNLEGCIRISYSSANVELSRVMLTVHQRKSVFY